MKKRILSILLTLCMTLCLTPISVFAEEVGTEGSAAIQLGADALSVLSKNVNTATAPTVYFGQNHENNPAAWRVIGYDGSGVTSSKGDITLLAAGAMGVIPFVDAILNNEYAPSNLKATIDALAEKLTTEENAAVKKRALTSGSYDGENTDCVAGGQVDNAVFWPLSAKEAIAVNNDLRALDPAHPNWVTTGWWLRSPGSDKYHLAVVRSEGSVQYSGYSVLIFNNYRTVRPAFNLNMNSVLFASAAVGGKPDGGLTEVSKYSGNEWKLTLLDSRRNFAVTEKTVSAAPDDTVTLNYKWATTGINEYISVILADNNGAQYYGRVAQPTAESGTVEIKIPSDIAPGDYTLKVFNEQYNGDYNTDYASNFTDIALTVENQPEQFTLASGGRYYFDLSAMNIPGTVNSNLPDSTLHYVPFTYAGTVDAYVLKPASNHVEDSSEQASVTKDKNAQYGYAYEHSLFIADYRVTTNISWIDLNNAGFIFGKTNTAGGINYTLRAPTMGSIYKSPMRGAPANNEWDQILTKNSDFIKELDNNRNISLFWGQDTSRSYDFNIRKTTRNSVNNFMGTTESSNYGICFRPVLEVLNSDTLGSDGLKVVTLDLGGGTLGNSSDAIQIIVKNGESFTAPATEGLSRPNSISEDAQLYWSDENGNCYKPGDTVPADVSRLSITGDYEVIYLPGTYGTGSAVTDMKPHNNILTLRGALFTRKGYTQVGWSTVDGGEKVYGFEDVYTQNEALTLYPVWNANQYTITFDTNGGSDIAPITQDYGAEITAPDNPTRKGYTFKGWDKEIPETMPAENMTVKAQWEINQYTIAFDTNGGSEIAPITQDYGTEITAPDNPTRKGYTFKGWDKEIPETMPAENMTVKAQWEINQYTITFDTNGGSEIAPITQDYGTEITAPADPTRKGYTFKGWDKEIPETMPADNITVKAQWEINQYTITFDTNGGSEIAPITQDYGTEITAPDNPTRKGYTFKGWDKEIPETMPAENITVKAQWEINQYTITFDTNGGSEIAPITQDYGTEITAPDNPTRKGYTFKGWDKEIPETMPAENITITARWKDTEKPTGEIIIGTNKWNEFLNELTFGIFFKDTQEVTINAVDNSGVVFVSYLVTDKELSESELNSLVFRAYEEPFRIEPNGEYIIYVMLVDENINITYLRSDRITLDNIQPVISGIENGKTYCEAQTVTVDEKYVDTVTVNGTVVTLDADVGFVLPPTNGEQKIVVTDKSGNNAEMTVTVNNGHTFGEWVSDNDGKHTRKCTVDGCDAFETENCSGGNATCTEKAVCDVCGKAYGEFDGTNHEGGVQEWTTRTAFNHEQKWNCCGAVIVASEAHEWKDGVCRECGYVCLHNDADKDHVCDYCEKTISEHVDKDKNHICDYCEKTISAHEDAPTEEIKKADTVTAKLPDDSKSPQTGDNSNLILWIALLIISGGVMKGVTAFGKSKKHSAKIKDK
ncbi:MAG TPA: InlB B-repeat-containing protein [Ruminococcus bromii]|nr:InlB B-repeat-containing protein [Ruminococcus bromii]HJI64108.1 InlB B-repeat-containing protein [Ruminococcus bromii]